MTPSETRAAAKRAEAAKRRERTERINALRHQRDREMKQLWDGWQARIAEARAA